MEAVFTFRLIPQGGTARVEVYGNGSGLTWSYGNLDISNHNAPGVAVAFASKAAVRVSVGANNLTVGNNGRDTTFFWRDSGWKSTWCW